MNKQKGFTIIELIVVIAIIAVLAAIVLINVNGYIAKAKDAAAMANLQTILTASAVYNGTNDSFKDFITQTTNPIPAGSAALCTGGTTLVPSGFIAPCKSIVKTDATQGYDLTFTCAKDATGGVCTLAGTNHFCLLISLKQKSGDTYCVDADGAKVNKTGGTCAAGICTP